MYVYGMLYKRHFILYLRTVEHGCSKSNKIYTVIDRVKSYSIKHRLVSCVVEKRERVRSNAIALLYCTKYIKNIISYD